MYAVVNLAGKQFTVQQKETVEVPLLEAAVGSVIRCDEVLFYADGSDVRVGQPRLEDVTVTAEVLRHAREKKIVVFKMKRRKKYRRRKGHRQGYTLLQIKEISA